jgi:membrane-bound metal-dependent hydrolase YbcI (DUF457 family)
MDPLAHALAGTVIARNHPSKAGAVIWACVLGALIPDIDIILTLFGRDFYVTEHRGFTHSLLGLVPMSLLAAWISIFPARLSKEKVSFFLLWVMALLGVASHILLDWCTSWGTMILWPERARLALDHLFIVDPWYWGILSIPILASLRYRKKRVAIFRVGLVVALAYHGLAAFNHHRAMVLGQREGPQALAFPQPLSPFRWSAYNRRDNFLQNAWIDFLKSPEPLVWTNWPLPMTPEVRAVMDSTEGKQYFWFCREPLWEQERQGDGSVILTVYDMRFQNYLMKEKIARSFGAKFLVKDGKASKL